MGSPRIRWKDTAENDMRLIDGSAMLDWTLDVKKWKGLLVAAHDQNGLLSCE